MIAVGNHDGFYIRAFNYLLCRADVVIMRMSEHEHFQLFYAERRKIFRYRIGSCFVWRARVYKDILYAFSVRYTQKKCVRLPDIYHM